MLKNTLINRAATKKVAKALDDLNDKVVYVGGAMVSFYIDDTAAEDIRPTKDLDLTFQVASFAELEELRVPPFQKATFWAVFFRYAHGFQAQRNRIDPTSKLFLYAGMSPGPLTPSKALIALGSHGMVFVSI